MRQPFWIWAPVALFASFAIGYLFLSIAFSAVMRPDGGFIRTIEYMLFIGMPMVLVTASYMLFWLWLNRHREFGLARVIFGIVAQTIALILASPFVLIALTDLLSWLPVGWLAVTAIFVVAFYPITYLFAIPTAILVGVLLPFFVLRGSYEALLSHRASPKSIPKHHLARPRW